MLIMIKYVAQQILYVLWPLEINFRRQNPSSHYKGERNMRISRSMALEIFGLKEDFSESDLRREYRRLAKIVHPDTGGDEQLFKFVDSCKNVLINGENVSENAHETNEHKSSSSNKNDAKSEKEKSRAS